MADPNNYYEQQRQGVKQRITQAGQQQGDVMARKFAAMGGGPGGAEVKAQQVQDQNLVQAQEGAIAGIDANEAQQKGTQEFQTSQAEAQRGFEGSQAQKARDLQAGQFGATFGLQKEIAANNQSNKLRELDMMGKQFEKQFELDFQNTQFNKEMSNWTKEHSGGLLGAGGFLGTGIGAGGRVF